MKQPDECKNMTDIREAIDEIDNTIVKLIARRSGYVAAAAPFKKDAQAVKDPRRVQQVLESKKKLAEKYGISPKLIENLYTTMIDFFINKEMNAYDNKNA